MSRFEQRIQATEPYDLTRLENPNVKANLEKLDANRGSALLAIDPRKIQSMQNGELTGLVRLLGLDMQEWGVLVFPELLLPNGRARNIAARTIDLPQEIKRHAGDLDEADRELAVLVLTRLLLLYLYVPLPTRSSGAVEYLKPLTVKSHLRAAWSVLAVALKKRGEQTERLFWYFMANDFLQASESARRRIAGLFSKLRWLGERGYWSDVPANIGDHEGDAVEPGGLRNSDVPTKGKPGGKYQPLSDDLVAQAGYRFQYIARELGPQLLRLVEHAIEINRRYPVDQYATATTKWRRLAFCEVLEKFEWVDSRGLLIKELPFELILGGKGLAARSAVAREFPPRMPGQFMKLLGLLQVAHLFIVLLSVGSRISEALSLRPDCLTAANDGSDFARGKTFKITHNTDGKDRDWPLPEVAVEAVRQQQRLLQLCGEMGQFEDDDPVDFDLNSTEQLWFKLTTHGEPLRDANAPLQRSIASLNLEHLLFGDQITPHRFRKTIARLIGLAVVGAPKILMDLFDHKTIEMTLHYILTDEQIRAEVIEVARAQTIAFAVAAVSDAVAKVSHEPTAAEYGGPGANKLEAAVTAEQARLGRKMGAGDIKSFSEMLTLGGQQWQHVRPGVICTKLPGQSGPCNKSFGAPKPDSCRSKCDHRLEAPQIRVQVEIALQEAIEGYESAKNDGFEALMTNWAGQIVAHLGRFKSLELRWRDHPAVLDAKELLSGRSSG